MNILVVVLRWIVAIPATWLVAEMVKRAYIFFLSYQANQNFLVDTILSHAVSGAIFGSLIIVIAPNAKKLAFGIASLLSLIIAVTYFSRYSDVLGGIAAVTHFVSTIIAGFMTLQTQEKDQEIRVSPNRNDAIEQADLGAFENPVRCFDPVGERQYLSCLREPNGRAPSFKRVGSSGTGPYGHMQDKYELTLSDGSIRIVFFDMYHKKYIEKRPLPGFLISTFFINLAKLKVDMSKLTMSSAPAISKKILQASQEDSEVLSLALNGKYSRDKCAALIANTYYLTHTGENTADGVAKSLPKVAEAEVSTSDAHLIYHYVTGL